MRNLESYLAEMDRDMDKIFDLVRDLVAMGHVDEIAAKRIRVRHVRMLFSARDAYRRLSAKLGKGPLEGADSKFFHHYYRAKMELFGLHLRHQAAYAAWCARR